MGYADNHSKFVAVLNRRHPAPRQFNALGHATAGLVAGLETPDLDMLPYPNPASGFCGRISRYPFIILEARNSGQLARLCADALAEVVAHNVFVTAMIGGCAQEQQAATHAAGGDDLDYICVVLFGDAARLDPMIRRFSLLRAHEENPHAASG